MRKPGFDTRRNPPIVRTLSDVYLSVISSTDPGPFDDGLTSKLAMYPSRFKMSAREAFSFEPGIFTVSCIAVFALRMRVRMSAIGSVIVIGASLHSPAGLCHAWDLPCVDHHTQ